MCVFDGHNHKYGNNNHHRHHHVNIYIHWTHLTRTNTALYKRIDASVSINDFPLPA